MSQAPETLLFIVFGTLSALLSSSGTHFIRLWFMKDLFFSNAAASDRLIPFIVISFWKTDFE